MIAKVKFSLFRASTYWKKLRGDLSPVSSSWLPMCRIRFLEWEGRRAHYRSRVRVKILCLRDETCTKFVINDVNCICLDIHLYLKYVPEM